jgi:hypothetical protein
MSPAAGPDTLMVDLLIRPAIIPPIMPEIIPDKGGTPLA